PPSGAVGGVLRPGPSAFAGLRLLGTGAALYAHDRLERRPEARILLRDSTLHPGDDRVLPEIQRVLQSPRRGPAPRARRRLLQSAGDRAVLVGLFGFGFRGVVPRQLRSARQAAQGPREQRSDCIGVDAHRDARRLHETGRPRSLSAPFAVRAVAPSANRRDRTARLEALLSARRERRPPR